LYDSELFHYHQQVTKRIKEDKTLDEWISENGEDRNRDNFRMDLMDISLVRQTLTMIAKEVEYFKTTCTEYDNIFVFFDSLAKERTFRNRETLIKRFREIYKKLLEVKYRG